MAQIGTGRDRSSEVRSGGQVRKGQEKSGQVMIGLDRLGQVRKGKVTQVRKGQEAIPKLAQET